ncbi:hypothetical protein NESM_000335100 [Novymonas esmeraldas]|uniref:Uncharacterized protein n=1 Tax=Novymonas esmeraldas TaxID=1808958 RepID=A0AAW0EMT4_9TRYP
MGDSPPPPSQELRMDIDSIEGDAPQPLAPHYDPPNGFATSVAAAAESPPSLPSLRAQGEDLRAGVQAARRASSPPAHDCVSGSSSPRHSIVKTRRSSATTVPTAHVSRRDSIRHPYSLASPRAENGIRNGHGDAPAGNGGGAPKSEDNMVLYRPVPQSRRRSAAIAVLSRSAAAGSPRPVNTTVSASPEHPETAAAPAPTTQADVKRYVATVMDQYTAMLEAWEPRVSVAEVYRDKPVRTGGHPAPARSRDRGVLERIQCSLESFLLQVEDAKSLLTQTCDDVPLTKSGRRGNVNSWREYCSRHQGALSDAEIAARLMQERVDKVLSAGRKDIMWMMYTRTASPRITSERGARSGSRDSASARTSSRPALRGASQPGTPRQHNTAATDEVRRGRSVRSARSARSGTAAAEASPPSVSPVGDGSASPYARHAVQRGTGAIRPGHTGLVSPAHAGVVPVDQPRRPWSGGPHSARRTVDVSTAPSSAATPPRRRPPHQSHRLLALHPDTVLQPPTMSTCNTYDSQTPYGRLSPQRRSASPGTRHSPTRSTIALSMPRGETAESSSGAPSHGALLPSSARQAVVVPPQLRTYSSPRGTTAAAAIPTAPTLHPLRHRQLLEVIEHYEKNAATLQRGDLQRARSCFHELYGETAGLHQYCQWIDDVAIKALRGS